MAPRQHKRFWALYDHLREVHDVDPAILRHALTMTSLRAVHKGAQPNCPWEEHHDERSE